MKQKVTLAALFILIMLQTGWTQNKKSGFDWDRVVYGGSIMPVFSTYGTNISANPFVGYKVTDKFVPGVMLSYQYTKLNYQGGISEIYNSYGISPFARYSIFNGFFAQAEFEFLNGTYEVRPLSEKFSFSENNLFIGGGYYNPLPGGRGGMFAQIMYNVTWRGSGNSIYPNPLIYRVGFTIF